MTVVQAFAGQLFDQWSEVVTADRFDEHTIVSPGVHRRRGQRTGVGAITGVGATGQVVDGTQIYVPENTAAFVFSREGIEAVMGVPGGYVYRTEPPTRSGDSVGNVLGRLAKAVTESQGRREVRTVAFINLREVRGLKFGTPRPLLYHDHFYGADLEILAFGTYSVRVADPITFVREFLPANTHRYSLADPQSRQTLTSELLQSFASAVNGLSSNYRVSELPSRTNEVVEAIASWDGAAASWLQRFGLQLVNVGIENIQFSPASRRLVEEYSRKRMQIGVHGDVPPQAALASFQHQVAEGIRNFGLPPAAVAPLEAGLSRLMGRRVELGDGEPIDAEPTTPEAPDERTLALRNLRRMRDSGAIPVDEYQARRRELRGE